MLVQVRSLLVATLVMTIAGATTATALPSRSGSARTRLRTTKPPVITSAPPTIGYGGSFVVGTPDAPGVTVALLIPAGLPVPFPIPTHPDFGLPILSRA